MEERIVAVLILKLKPDEVAVGDELTYLLARCLHHQHVLQAIAGVESVGLRDAVRREGTDESFRVAGDKQPSSVVVAAALHSIRAHPLCRHVL